MNRKIFLVRHGESADKQQGQSDFDRELTDSGKKSVKILGEMLNQRKESIDSCISSPAVRAQQTIEILMRQLSIDLTSVEFDALLYNGSDQDYWNVISQVTGSLLLVGHNPTISFVIGKFTGNFSISLTPGQCALIELDSNNAVKMQLLGPFRT